MGYDAGALIFKIQAAGAQLFQRDLDQADQSIKKVTGSAKAAKPALEGQGKATDEVGSKSSDAAEKQKKQAQATGNQVQAAKTLSLALIAGGVAITAMVGLSVAKFASFDAQMSNVRASTMATVQDQKALGEAALDAGADTAYSANEAAAAEEELAKAGQSVAQIVNGSLNGALSLAAAGQLQVARSAEIMATTLTQFRLPAEQAAHVSDVLAAGAGKAQGSVDDLALALSYVGPLAGSVGLSLDETAGTIAYFATQGVIGEKAGTALRGVLASLQAPSALADAEMKKYNISVFDAQGNMLSMAGIAEQLRTRLGGLTEQERLAALGRIFGNESLNAATLLYEGGAAKVEEWTAAVDDTGYAAEQARIRQDNLAGDVEKLGGAFDTALIKTGSGANDVLRDMVQIVTQLVDWYGELPSGVQTTALVVGVFAGAILLASGAVLGLTARFSELRVQLELNNISMGKTAAIGAGVGLALAGIVTVIALIAAEQAAAQAKAKAYADTFEDGSRKITKATRDMAKEALVAKNSFLWIEQDSAADAAEKLGISLDLVTDAATGNADAMKQLKAELAAVQDGSLATANSVADIESAVNLESGAIERAVEMNRQKNSITDEGVAVTKSSADAYVEAAEGAEDLNSQLRELIDRINEANSIGQDAVTTNAAYQESLAGIAEEVQRQKDAYTEANGSLDGFNASLDQNTEAGSANAAMLAGVAADAIAAADAQLTLDQQTMSGTDAADKYVGTLAAQRQAFIDSATAAGFNKDEVIKLADQIFAMPSQKQIDIIANTAAASERIDSFVREYDGKVVTLQLTTNQVVVGNAVYGGLRSDSINQADGGKVEFFANGGRSEHHIAQFARAGDYRVWAEPETGGEWYIPASPAKRESSTQVLAEAAHEFGYTLVPAGAQQYANGSPASATASLDGLSISGRLELGLDGFVTLVDGRISAREGAQTRVTRGRTQQI